MTWDLSARNVGSLTEALRSSASVFALSIVFALSMVVASSMARGATRACEERSEKMSCSVRGWVVRSQRTKLGEVGKQKPVLVALPRYVP